MTVGLQSILEEVVGNGRRLSQDEIAYHCPFCNHRKKKLQVNLVTHKYHCWVCDAKGKSIFSLFKKLNATKSQFDRLRIVVDGPSMTIHHADISEQFIALPDEFQKLSIPQRKNPFYRNAIKYVLDRGMTKYDIFRYNLGFCSDGNYANRIIIPSYDSMGSLNYFSARSFSGDTFKYKNPPISKDVIGFESEVNWDLPIILVEGVFDAIRVKRNSIPMFGKFPSNTLQDALVMHDVSEVTILLDPDAMQDAVKIASRFVKKDIVVRLIELTDCDAGNTSFEVLGKLIRDTKPITFSELIRLKMKYPRLQGVAT